MIFLPDTNVWIRFLNPGKNQVKVRFLANFESLSFDDDAARRYGEIRSDLVRKGTPIGPNDLMISAIASVHDAILVTQNTREFGRITDLKIEDWE